jgi:protein-S-isoprenylcysteine O-methyltransferase Ste14
VGILIYIKWIEEKELEERFGSEYLEYKKRTPFLIPFFRKKDG